MLVTGEQLVCVAHWELCIPHMASSRVVIAMWYAKAASQPTKDAAHMIL